ncbi:ABC transporter ATP-binding protein/permease [Thauera sp.]|uniref:ABC transporter ATP-binding protein/permease n=1 Tax=Thauera sp. TaxID=1905334 RepID=UPI0025810D81|nr:ABC transporter ATP-binding protein/permease [Thauera sp.]
MQPSSSPPAGGSSIRQFWRLSMPYWHSERKWKAGIATLLLVLLTLAQVALAIWISYWHRELFDALEARSMREVLVQAAVFGVIFALTVAVTAAHLHIKRWLQLDWRQWLTRRLLDAWLSDRHLYQLRFTVGDHDNPDGRIAEDIRIATESVIGLAHSLLFSLLILGSFADILSSVSGSFEVPGTDIVVGGYLVWLAFLYAGLGTVLGALLGRPLVKATNRLQTVEANLRYGLAREREHAESIALMRGEAVERRHADSLFDDVGRGWNRQTIGYLGIVSFSTAYGTLLPVFPILVAAPQYIAGVMTLGVLMQAAQAFQRLTSALSWPVDNLGELARCRASMDRIVSLYQDLEALSAPERARAHNRIQVRVGTERKLVLRNLTLSNPDGRVLAEHLDTVVRRGERVLIGGDTSVAVCLFKAVAGLWPWGQGEIVLPADHGIVFLPQRPYFPDGTLKAALCYPHAETEFEHGDLLHVLECAGVAWLAPRLDESDSWDHALPLRARQRLAIARVLLQRPAWVFLEEATNALDPETELLMIELLHRELPDSTLMMISFHNGMSHHFTHKLAVNRLHEEKYVQAAPAGALLGEA